MNSETQQQIAQHVVADTLAVKVSSAATYTGAGVTVFFGFTVNEWGVIFGILFTASAFVINFWFQHDRRKREVREHKLRMRALKEDRRIEDIGHNPERRQ